MHSIFNARFSAQEGAKLQRMAGLQITKGYEEWSYTRKQVGITQTSTTMVSRGNEWERISVCRIDRRSARVRA